MKIGIDFDNTIANYDGVFFKAAISLNLIPPSLPSSKSSVRSYLRAFSLEDEWTKLQGYVYGSKMELAKPYDGVILFIEECLKNKIELFIVSHKSKYPILGPKYDLHTAAGNWLQMNPVLKKLKVYFELTLEEKLQRIEALNCDYFIDDLPELLNKDTFPKHVKRVLFDAQDFHNNSTNYQRFITWHEIRDYFEI